MSSGLYPSAWLQQGALGHGGASENINRTTLAALWKRGLIYQVKRGKWPTGEYVLSLPPHDAEKGKGKE